MWQAVICGYLQFHRDIKLSHTLVFSNKTCISSSLTINLKRAHTALTSTVPGALQRLLGDEGERQLQRVMWGMVQHRVSRTVCFLSTVQKQPRVVCAITVWNKGGESVKLSVPVKTWRIRLFLEILFIFSAVLFVSLFLIFLSRCYLLMQTWHYHISQFIHCFTVVCQVWELHHVLSKEQEVAVTVVNLC